jgi:hypothetical protein
VDLHDWLLFLHVLSAFLVVSALVVLWTVVFATRPMAPVIEGRDATRIGRIAGPLVGIGMTVALVLGIWLAIQVDAYEIWDTWVIAALVLWAVGGWSGTRSGKAFESNDAGRRPEAIRLQTVNSAAILLILVLMIWKPGA